MADKPETGGTGAAKPLPGIATRPPPRPRVVDEKLQAIDDLLHALALLFGHDKHRIAGRHDHQILDANQRDKGASDRVTDPSAR